MEAAGQGAILNISSMSAENKNVNMASYSSSKAAVSHLTRNIAFDLGPKGIRVNLFGFIPRPLGRNTSRGLPRGFIPLIAIAPGAIKIDALATVLTPDIEKAMLKHTPMFTQRIIEDEAGLRGTPSQGMGLAQPILKPGIVDSRRIPGS